jgi:hypothetical protein
VSGSSNHNLPPGSGPSGGGSDQHERLLELLCDRATIGLSTSEEAELQLLAAELGVRPDESLERAAARLDLAVTGRPTTYSAMPAELYQKIAAKGEQWCRQSAEPLPFHSPDLPSLMEGLEPDADPVIARVGFWPRARKSFPVWGGWATAAALALVAGTMALRPAPTAPAPVAIAMNNPAAEVAPSPSPAPAPVVAVAARQQPALSEPVQIAPPVQLATNQPSPVEALERLLASKQTDLVMAAAQPMASASLPGPVDAEFVWSDEDSRGFLTVAGLPVNAPDRQYQVWVHDAARPEPHPVNGGTFDIPVNGGKWVIAIEPKLPVFHASGFEVTLERVGGVVISSPERVLLSAPVFRAEDFHGPPDIFAGVGGMVAQ